MCYYKLILNTIFIKPTSIMINVCKKLCSKQISIIVFYFKNETYINRRELWQFTWRNCSSCFKKKVFQFTSFWYSFIRLIYNNKLQISWKVIFMAFNIYLLTNKNITLISWNIKSLDINSYFWPILSIFTVIK